MPINKFTTLLDLSRQAKILTGETATFDGKISSGIPFSGYPTGVDTATTVSLGVISTQTAVFSGGTGTQYLTFQIHLHLIITLHLMRLVQLLGQILYFRQIHQV